jgi:hypothetical protein
MGARPSTTVVPLFPPIRSRRQSSVEAKIDIFDCRHKTFLSKLKIQLLTDATVWYAFCLLNHKGSGAHVQGS